MDTIEPTINQENIYTQPKNKLSARPVAAVVLLSLIAGGIGGFFGAELQGRGIGGAVGIKQNNERLQTVTIKEESAVVDVVKKASPAVVSIVVSRDVGRMPGFSLDPFNLDPFAPFFGFTRGQQNQPESNEPNIRQVGAGSGFFVSGDGLVLTNKHVVSNERASYTVVTSDKRTLEAKVVARDPGNDLAILKVEVQGAPVLELSDSNQIEIGQRVVAIGYSLGQYQNTVTTGVVSGIGRSITASGSDGAEQLEGVIQTDAAINLGNSGGPLLNVLGQVIGINTAIDREGQLVGFAIPSNDAKRAVESYQKTGKITRAYLGVRYVLITPDLARAEKLPREHGALIVRGDSRTDFAVQPGSPADKAGLVENDIILEVNGKRIDEELSLVRVLRDFSPGQSVQLKVYHRGEEKMVSVVLEENK